MYRYFFTVLFLIFSQYTFAQSEAVIKSDFPDPTVIIADGKYYAYATNSSYNGKPVNIQVAVSDDLKAWKIIGDALPQKPSWGYKDFWAPHVLYDSYLKKYVLFYSAETVAEEEGKALGIAFSDKPQGPFVDKGMPLLAGPGFREIDPFAITDRSGKNYLVWGSDFQPLKIQEMNKSWTAFQKGSSPTPLIFPGREKEYTNLLEGAWIDYHKGYYYLYYSGDNCCGNDARYAVLVARAKKLTGPYKTLGEYYKTGKSVVLEKNANIIAPGHNSVIKDKAGRKWIAYHAIPQSAFNNKSYGRHFYLSKIIYRKGWPVVLLEK